MKRYLQNRWIRIALALFALGSVPLAAVALLVVLAPLLLPEFLFIITFWPVVFLLAAGIVQVRGQK